MSENFTKSPRMSALVFEQQKTCKEKKKTIRKNHRWEKWRGEMEKKNCRHFYNRSGTRYWIRINVFFFLSTRREIVQIFSTLCTTKSMSPEWKLNFSVSAFHAVILVQPIKNFKIYCPPDNLPFSALENIIFFYYPHFYTAAWKIFIRNIFLTEKEDKINSSWVMKLWKIMVWSTNGIT